MRHKKIKTILILLAVVGVVGFAIVKLRSPKQDEKVVKEISPVMGGIKKIISTTGTVLPKNRLEVKPPVSGRVDEIMVREGQKVTAGQILAWMSSTERAALLDAARGKGEESLSYWKEVYKAIPLISPIGAEVIVATTQPGQTVTTSDAVIVLSDQLIVRAQVDETDIGKITADMKAIIALDAYPDNKIKASVEHIYYESKTVNNVTIYEVDLIPDEIPPFFRSGMNATVDFIVQSKENILIIPLESVLKTNGDNCVLVMQGDKQEPTQVRVALGIFDDNNVEVISGISAKDMIILSTKKYALPKSTSGSNPFMPGRSPKRTQPAIR